MLNGETGLTEEGYVVNGGTSLALLVGYDAQGTPEARALTIYGQSDDPSSPWYWDQVERFRHKAFRQVRFTEPAIAAGSCCREEVIRAAR